MAHDSRPSSTASATGTARRARTVVVIAALVVVLALASAFAWPGWAVRTAPQPAPVSTSIASGTPTIEATALPDDASALLQALPDHVGSYARTAVDTTDAWSTAKPLEEYAVTYSGGDDATAVKLTVGQWSTAEEAADEYADLAKELKGTQLSAGNIKVSGANTGSYVVAEDADDPSRASALWRNDTVCFLMAGPKDAVVSLHRVFPL